MAGYKYKAAAAGATPGAITWATFDPTDGSITKSDPNTMEVSTPTDQGGGWWEYTIDGATSRTAPGDMLAYSFELTGMSFADRFRVFGILEVRSESSTKLMALAAVVDNSTISGANGVYSALSEETAGSYDQVVRDIATAVPNTGSVAGNPPAAHFEIFHGNASTAIDHTVVDTSTDPSTWRARPGFQTDGTPASTGTARLALLLSSRAVNSSSETLQVRLRWAAVAVD